MQKIINATPEVINNIGYAMLDPFYKTSGGGYLGITPPGQPKSNITPPATQLTSPYYDWSKFGYKKPARTLPTQVRKVLGTGLEDDVAGSLWNQYNRASQYIAKKGDLRGFGEKFVNPATGKLYYVAQTRGKNPRLTLKSQQAAIDAANKRRSNDIQSMTVQELTRKYQNASRNQLNAVEKAKFEEATNEIMDRIRLNAKTIHRYNQYPDIQESIAAKIAADGRELDALTEGYHYGEHGHAINSKVWDYVKRVKRFANQKLMFLPGDGKNYHLVFEPNKANQQFRNTKNNFETVIDGLLGEAQNRYPDVIVNYNPILSGRGKKIRLERLSTLKLGYKTRRGKKYPDLMFGDLIAEYDFDKNGFMNTAQIKKWLDTNLPGEKRVGKKPKLGPKETNKKTRKPPIKVEDLTLKQSTKKKYVKKPKK